MSLPRQFLSGCSGAQLGDTQLANFVRAIAIAEGRVHMQGRVAEVVALLTDQQAGYGVFIEADLSKLTQQLLQQRFNILDAAALHAHCAAPPTHHTIGSSHAIDIECASSSVSRCAVGAGSAVDPDHKYNQWLSGLESESGEPEPEGAVADVRRWRWGWDAICAAFHVDFSRGVLVEKCLYQHSMDRLLEPTSPLRGKTYLLRGVSNQTHQDIAASNERSGNDSDVLVKKVILALKMAISLVHFGMPTIDAEHTVSDLCSAMGMPKPDLDFSHRKLTARFIQGTHQVPCKRGIDFDKLTSCAELTDELLSSPELLDGEVAVEAAIATLHDIQNRSSPYGSFIQLLNSESLCIFATLAAFSGGYDDAKAVAIIAPVSILVSAICKHWWQMLGSLELVLAPIVTGTMTALVYTHVYGHIALCHISIWYLSVILIHLPGSDVVYGCYEALHASVVNGGARVVGAVLQAMALAVSLNIGWQLTGREAVTSVKDPGTHKLHTLSGAAASFVPFSSCGYTNDQEGAGTPTDDSVSWQIAWGLYNIILITNICIAFNMRIRKMLGPVLVGYCSLFLYGFLSFGLKGRHTIASYIVNVITLIVAGSLGVLLELFSGYPSCISIIPVVLILAPGSSSVRISLGDMQYSGGVVVDLSMGIWDDLVLMSISFALGLYIVLEVWKTPLRIKRDLRARVGQFARSFVLSEASATDFATQ